MSTKRTAAARSLHDSLFDKDQQHIELGSVNTAFPDKVRHHIESNGDSVDHDGAVTLKSGRKVTTDAYLGRSLKDKSKEESSDIQSELTNWKKNKSNSNTRLVLSRHPADIASASTGTHWTSCADLSDGIDREDDLARDKMPEEIKHGTMIALHVHKDAVPNEDGSYDSKDIIGRTLIKPHKGKKEITAFRENKSYGMFPRGAERKVDAFLDRNAPRSEGVYQKNQNVYNDDRQGINYTVSKLDINDPDHIPHIARAHVEGRIHLDKNKLDQITQMHSPESHAILAQGHSEGKIKLDRDQLDTITSYQHSRDAHLILANGHARGNITLDKHHVNNIIGGKRLRYCPFIIGGSR